MSNKRDIAPQQKINALHSKSRAAYGYSKGQASPPKRRTIAPIIKQEASEASDEFYSDDLNAPTHHGQSTLQGPSHSAPSSKNKLTGSAQPRASNAGPDTRSQPPSKASSKHTSRSHRSSALDSDDDDSDDDLAEAVMNLASVHLTSGWSDSTFSELWLLSTLCQSR